MAQYKDYLQFIGHYKHQRDYSNEPPIVQPPTTTETKTVKTEIYIEVNKPPKDVTKNAAPNLKPQIGNDQTDSIGTVQETIKLFKQNDKNHTKDKVQQTQTSNISELSKQFEKQSTITPKLRVTKNEETNPVLKQKIDNLRDWRNSSNNEHHQKPTSKSEEIDPILKRKIGNAVLRDWYNGYNAQANNYVNSLPKHMVKKNDTHIQQIIENITQNGGLEKLSGRANPDVDNK